MNKESAQMKPNHANVCKRADALQVTLKEIRSDKAYIEEMAAMMLSLHVELRTIRARRLIGENVRSLVDATNAGMSGILGADRDFVRNRLRDAMSALPR